MAQRISRAKQRIKTSGVPFAMPTDARARGAARRRAARALSDLQRGLREQQRRRRCSAPICRTRRSGSTRAVHDLLPDDARGCRTAGADAADRCAAAARTGPDGELIPLAEQDRRCGTASAIAEGDRAGHRGAVARRGRRRISCRRRSPRFTTKRRAPKTPTGRRLPRCTAARAHVRQPDGDAQSRDRRGDGRRSGGRARRWPRPSRPTRD